MYVCVCKHTPCLVAVAQCAVSRNLRNPLSLFSVINEFCHPTVSPVVRQYRRWLQCHGHVVNSIASTTIAVQYRHCLGPAPSIALYGHVYIVISLYTPLWGVCVCEHMYRYIKVDRLLWMLTVLASTATSLSKDIKAWLQQ